jgi:hypothetical protein
MRSSNQLGWLDADEVRECLPMRDAIEAMWVAFDDDREVPPRVTLGVSLFMAGRVGGHTGVKVVSTVPGHSCAPARKALTERWGEGLRSADQLH